MGLEEGQDDSTSETARVSETHVQKRRKILKSLKRFTKKGDTRSKQQKGWSNEGYRYHEALTEEILNGEEAAKPFVDLYRELTLKIESKKGELAHPMKKNRYVPDCKKVWQLA